MNWFRKHVGVGCAIAAFLIALVLLIRHVHAGYEMADRDIRSVSVVTNIHYNDMLLYTTEEHEGELAFTRLTKPVRPGDTLEFRFRQDITRNFRIYFGRASDTSFISAIWMITGSGIQPLSLSDFRTEGITVRSDTEHGIRFRTAANGFIQLAKNRISRNELILMIALVVCLSAVFAFLVWHGVRIARPVMTNGRVDWAGGVFLASIFLPHPWFNIAFMATFLLILRSFSARRFSANRTGWLLIGFFVVYLVNDLTVSRKFDFRIIETMLPFLCLPFYFACLKGVEYRPAFLLSAVVFGWYFTSTSVLDFAVYRNLLCFSFDNFTKYVHPVYYSYLLFVCLVYATVKLQGRVRGVLISCLLIQMVMAGSKLVIVLALLFFISRFIRRRSAAMIGFAVAAIVFLLLHSPTRARFRELFEIRHAVAGNVSQKYNGVTIRLLLWEESLKTENWKVLLFGSGVDEHSSQKLSKRFADRGLKSGQAAYDPHNQYITTYYKTGLAGLLVLFWLCVYVYRIARRSGSAVDIWTFVLFVSAMITESLLQRVTGIYIFSSLFLLQHLQLINRTPLENSDSRHKGRTQ